ncbi:hypothetical protein WAI453_011626 [Rhynchosporium graminicola]
MSRCQFASINRNEAVAVLQPQLDSVSRFVSATSPNSLSEDNNYQGDAHQQDDENGLARNALHIGLVSPGSSFVEDREISKASSQQNDALSIIAEDPEFDNSPTSNLISRDIKLTTTMDLLTAGEVPFQLSFAFFLDTVDCPAITPFDSVNWRHMKLHVIELGMSNAAISSAIIAISALYKAQMYSLPDSKALSLYQSSLESYEKLLHHPINNPDMIIVTVFLHCIFQYVHCETVPLLRDPSESLLASLRIWSTYDILPDHKNASTHIKQPANQVPNPSSQLLQILGTSIFDFYVNLQIISGEIARLTHYHRSRTTGADQEEVTQEVISIKSRLFGLWENRSATQTQTSNDLRSHLAPEISNPLISMIGLCSAAYHVEFVELGRLMGDPLSESTDSKQALRQIRETIDSDSTFHHGEKLNPGYLRPLFLNTIECMDRNETKWAVEKMKQIRRPIARSDFFASFGRALSDAQMMKDRRVTSKYFCIWYFGAAPPYL